jgi:hypothetical protein
VVSLGVDEGANRLTIGVSDTIARHSVLAAATASGIPLGAIRVVKAEIGRPTKTLRDDFRPAPGGVQIADPDGNCTLGFNAETLARDTVLVTASHCTHSWFALDSAGLGQNSHTSSEIIATDEVAESIWHTSGCPGGMSPCFYSDAALIRYDDPADAAFAKVAKTALGSITVPSFAGRLEITAKSWVMADDTVRFVGRTSGTKELRVWDTCHDQRLSYQGTFVWAICAMLFRGKAMDGDSGAPIYLPLPATDNIGIVGLVFGSVKGEFGGTEYDFVLGNALHTIEYQLGGPLIIY